MNRFQPRERRTDWAVLAMLMILAFAWAGCRPTEVAEKPSAGESDGPGVSSDASVIKPASEASATKPVLEASGKQSAQEVLESMVAKYKGAGSYVDKATVHLEAQVGDQKVDQSYDFSVALVRPNKVRLEVYVGNVVSDGEVLWASSGLLPDQILKRPAPPALSLKDVFADEFLATSLTQGPTQSFTWVPPQLLLLLAGDPLKTLLHQVEKPVLAGTGELAGQPCYKIELSRPEGKYLLWIDTQSLVLRRIEYPFEELARQSDPNQPLERGTLVAEFHEAQLDPAEISPNAFRFEPDPSMQVVEALMEPGLRLLGKPVPDFKFVDLEGKEITPKTFEGKTAVLYFWATWCGPCRISLPLVEKVYHQHKDQEKVAFLAVSVDLASTPDDALQKTFEQWSVDLPIARDPEQHVGKLFHSISMPTLFVVGSDGVVQCSESSADLKLAAELGEYLSVLLDGRNLYPQVLRRAEEKHKNQQALLENWIDRGLFTAPMNEGQEIPRADVAAKSEPKALTLKSLWKSGELKDPGNLLTVPKADGSSQVFLLDGVKSAVELAPDGKVAATHSLELDEQEVASYLRSAVDGSQKRYFASCGMMQMRAHVFDEQWRPVSSYPSDAIQNRHAGILDIQLADLQGDGNLELCVGYLGVVGVQAASLEGKRLWSNRSVDTVMRVAVLGPDAQGKRNLLCTNTRGTLVTMDSQGESQGEIQVPGAMLQWIVASDLDGKGPPELCGISVQDLGVCEVIGLNLQGERLWEYPLPKGVHNRPVEQIVAGRLKRGEPGQWLVPGADGSIHVIAADGTPIDQFNYGAELHGLATAEFDGQPVLLIASAGSVEALAVSWPGP